MPCAKKRSTRSALRRKATENGFKVGTYEDLIPQADLVVNLTPDKQHSSVVRAVQPSDERRRGAGLLPRLQHR